jgi:hypothetical protein
MFEFELPESGHGFEADPSWDVAWDAIPSPWESAFHH